MPYGQANPTCAEAKIAINAIYGLDEKSSPHFCEAGSAGTNRAARACATYPHPPNVREASFAVACNTQKIAVWDILRPEFAIAGAPLSINPLMVLHQERFG